MPASEEFKQGDPLLKLLSLIEYPAQKLTFSTVDQYFCLTDREKNALSTYAPTTVSPMGVDFVKYAPMQKQTAREQIDADFDSDFVIHFLGRLIERKGVDDLLRAVRILDDRGVDVRLNIAGSGPFETQLKQMVTELELERAVQFYGFIPDAEKISFYNAADVVCFPSKSEPYGIVPIEALACKTPLVATDSGAVQEIAKKFRGGVIVCPPEDDKILADSLEQARERNLSQDIDRESGKTYFSWESIIENTISIYNSKA